MQKISSSASFADSKPHYDLLDGLRGVAALLVVWYHVFEGYAFAGGTSIETINHGYLAVDFFFILSGFVIGYEEFLQAPSGASASYGSIGSSVGGNYFFHSGQCAVGRKSCSHFFSNGGSFVCHVFYSCCARCRI